MIETEGRISAFSMLGEYLRRIETNPEVGTSDPDNQIKNLITGCYLYNPWFTESNVRNAIRSIADSLTEDILTKWIEPYRKSFSDASSAKKIGVVMAGNIPLVGFHDFLCVLMSGNKIYAKLSADDNQLIPLIADKLMEIEPGFKNCIEFTEDRLKGFDAIIATGSNNTSRYFEYYFGKVPNIIRKNRNSVAVLTGKESMEELEDLGKDVFQYFGLGCRSISKFYVPGDYSFDQFFKAIEKYQFVIENNKYNNNYDYYKSIYLINNSKHFDNGFLILKEESSHASPPAVIHFEFYDDLNILKKKLNSDKNFIQCVVGRSDDIHEAIPFGKAQQPELWDYADGVDTMEFLVGF